MLQGCTKLATLTLPSAFTCASVTDMSSMFASCPVLASLDLSYFDTGNATNMSSLFDSTLALAQVKLGASWSFKGNGSTVLCTLRTSPSPYSGNWQAVGSGSVSSPGGDVYSPSDLANAYDGATMSDTYVWEHPTLTGTVTLSGTGLILSTLTASASGTQVTTLSYVWYSATDATSTGSQVGTGTTYAPTIDQYEKYIYATVSDSNGFYKGKVASSRIQITANISVTVPTAIPVSVAADGGMTGPTPSSSEIKNTSAFAIHVSTIQATAASGFNLVTNSAYPLASGNNTFWMTTKPNSGTAIQLASYTAATAPPTGEWNLAATTGTIDLTTAGFIKNVDKNLSSSSMTAITISWAFVPGNA